MAEKKGVSPVIATVLLIAMVIVIALIIFLWVREIGGETITKLGGRNIQTVCSDVEFRADYYGGQISITNTGIVPIFNFKVQFVKRGNHYTENIYELGDWPDTGLKQGASFTTNSANAKIDSQINKVVLIPVLMGTSSKGERAYVCNQDTYGYEVFI